MAAAMQAHNTEQKTDLRCRLHHERRSASTHREWLAREWHGLIRITSGTGRGWRAQCVSKTLWTTCRSCPASSEKEACEQRRRERAPVRGACWHSVADRKDSTYSPPAAAVRHLRRERRFGCRDPIVRQLVRLVRRDLERRPRRRRRGRGGPVAWLAGMHLWLKCYGRATSKLFQAQHAARRF